MPVSRAGYVQSIRKYSTSVHWKKWIFEPVSILLVLRRWCERGKWSCMGGVQTLWAKSPENIALFEGSIFVQEHLKLCATLCFVRVVGGQVYDPLGLSWSWECGVRTLDTDRLGSFRSQSGWLNGIEDALKLMAITCVMAALSLTWYIHVIVRSSVFVQVVAPITGRWCHFPQTKEFTCLVGKTAWPRNDITQHTSYSCRDVIFAKRLQPMSPNNTKCDSSRTTWGEFIKWIRTNPVNHFKGKYAESRSKSIFDYTP